MKKAERNYAFIDSQNLNLGVRSMGWQLDFQKFRVYLREKYGVKRAYLFMGYLPELQSLYNALQSYGYVLVFKPVLRKQRDGIKGNVDAELVLQSMIDCWQYDQAVIVSGDGDFHCLLKYLYHQGKLRRLIVPNRHRYSILLRRALPYTTGITFLNDLRIRLSYQAKTTNRS